MQLRTKAQAWLAASSVVAITALMVASSSSAATREPMPRGLKAVSPSAVASGEASDPASSSPEADDGLEEGYREYSAGAGYSVEASSAGYGEPEVQAVVDVLGSLIHGPELNQLSVYVATPEEIASICGSTVLACYQPESERMIVSGVDRSSGGVPRDFAIAHEYGHHIANSQEGAIYPAIDVGTTRWATYERVCQFSRARKLFPGDQGNHYFEDPEEAFAESYAHLNDPQAKVSWQFASFLRPTPESLKKIRKDIAKPWRGPVSEAWDGVARSPGPVSRSVDTPLDGNVAVSIVAPAGADLMLTVRDAESHRLLARAATDSAGLAGLSYGNCGHSKLKVAVKTVHGATPFSVKIERP